MMKRRNQKNKKNIVFVIVIFLTSIFFGWFLLKLNNENRVTYKLFRYEGEDFISSKEENVDSLQLLEKMLIIDRIIKSSQEDFIRRNSENTVYFDIPFVKVNFFFDKELTYKTSAGYPLNYTLKKKDSTYFDIIIKKIDSCKIINKNINITRSISIPIISDDEDLETVKLPELINR